MRLDRARIAAILCALAAAGVPASCGGEGSSSSTAGPTAATQPAPTGPPPSLSAADVAVIAKAKEAVSTYCSKVGAAIGGQGAGPSEGDYLDVTAALDDLAGLAARKPDAETNTPDRITAEVALGDIAENLEGTDCDPRLVEKINEALAQLPAE
jgi:hypothetical protein